MEKVDTPNVAGEGDSKIVTVQYSNESLNIDLIEGDQFDCSICYDRFTDRLNIAAHYILNHGHIFCVMCNYLFTDEIQKSYHEKEHHYPLVCIQCESEFYCYKELKKHYGSHGSLICDYCPSYFSSADRYPLHLTNYHHIRVPEISKFFTIHENGTHFICQLCDKRKLISNLITHYSMYHRMSFPMTMKGIKNGEHDSLLVRGFEVIDNIKKCSVCHITYNEEITPLVHDVFCKGRPVCDECDTVIENNEELKNHNHIDKTTEACKFGCDTVNLKRDELKEHIKTIHGIISCEFCGFIASEFGDKMGKHLQAIHKVSVDVYKNAKEFDGLFNIKVIGQKKQIVCNFCTTDLASFSRDVNKLSNHFLSIHGMKTKIFIKKLKKNTFSDLMSTSDANSSNVNCSKSDSLKDYLKYFEIESLTSDEFMNQQTKTNFDTTLVQCVYSSDEENSDVEDENESNADDIETISRSSLQCPMCLNKFSSERKLFLHLKCKHGFKMDSNCKYCCGKFATKGSLSRHMKRIHGKDTKSSLKCQFCEFQSVRKKELLSHVTEHKDYNKEPCEVQSIAFHCKFCPKKFWTKTQVDNHQKEKHANNMDEISLMCHVCNEKFTRKSVLIKHISEHHKDEKINYLILKCSVCKVVFTDLETVKSHMTSEHPNSIARFCAIAGCQNYIQDSDSLINHLRKVHKKFTGDAGIFKCKVCKKTLHDSNEAMKHYMQIHDQEKTTKSRGFRCRLCQEVFQSNDTRVIHVKEKHGEKVFGCTICGKSFNSRSCLYIHKGTHSAGKNLECPHCNKTFVRKDSYKEHLLIHEGPTHPCPHCSKLFVQRSNLIRHLRIHTGEKPYKCRYSACTRSFSDGGARTAHENVHTKKDNCQCPVCDKVFSRKQKLNYHMRVHTGENLYICDICDKKCTNSYNFKIHQMIHGIGVINCQLCSRKFRSSKALEVHKETKHNGEIIITGDLDSAVESETGEQDEEMMLSDIKIENNSKLS